MSHFGCLNAIENHVRAPPIIINETILTLKHVMQRLDAIEKKMSTNEQIEELYVTTLT